MALAAGGHIKQIIYRDTSKAEEWDTELTTAFSVQLLNTEAFTRFTGLPAPKTPVTASTYAGHGFPYFDIYNEKPSGVRGDFRGIRSVNDIDKLKPASHAQQMAAAEVSGSTSNPVILLDREKVNRPFRHISELEAGVREMKLQGSGKQEKLAEYVEFGG